MSDTRGTHDGSPIAAFAWTGTILVNAAFVTLILWGAATLWPVGFAICAAYSGLLFFLAHRSFRLHSNQEEEPQQQQQDDGLVMELHPQPRMDSYAPVGALGSDAAFKTPITVSLLYGLAVVALGATGSFLPINIFSCPPYYIDPNKGDWNVNVTSIPDNVLDWAEGNGKYPDDDYTDLLYIPSTGVTLFSGTNHSDESQGFLWEVSSDGMPPKLHPEYFQVFQFLLVSQDTGCFIANKRKNIYSHPSIVCLDTQGFHESTTSSSSSDEVIPYTMIASEGILWYKASDYAGEGRKVYSMNPATMESILHSSYTPPGDNPPAPCNEATASRKKASLALLLTASPVTLASVRLWIDKGIPSMAVTTLLGVSLIYTCLYIMLWPKISAIGLELWYSLAGATYTIILSRLLLIQQRWLRKWPLVWGINAGGSCFFVGTFLSLGVADSDDPWRWIAVTFLCYAPLIVCGMGNGCMLLVILGAVGLLIDVFRFGIYLSSEMPDSMEFLVTFTVLAVGGIGIGAIGYWLQQRQEKIRAILKSVLNCIWKIEAIDDLNDLLLNHTVEQRVSC